MEYTTLATDESIQKTTDALRERGFLPEYIPSATDALNRIKELIPAGASVMNGASRTLEEIGFTGYLKEGTHGWNNLHDAIHAEKDPAAQAALRKQSVVSDYYLGSVHALSQTGEFLVASASGSQLPHIVFTSPNLILVVSAKKIVPTLADAFDRLENHVFPLEDARMKAATGMGSMLAKILVMRKEPAFMGRKIHLLIVGENLGF